MLRFFGTATVLPLGMPLGTLTMARGIALEIDVLPLPNGSKKRLNGTPSINTKRACEEAERAHIERALNPSIQRKEAPTFRTFGEEFKATYVRSNSQDSRQRSVAQNRK